MLLLLSTGCERVRRAQQCHELANAVNETMSAIEHETENNINAESLRSSAQRYSDLSEALGPMEFSDRQMALDVEAFRRTLTTAADLCRNLAAAVKSNERAQAAQYQNELEALKTSFKGHAYKMNSWCREP